MEIEFPNDRWPITSDMEMSVEHFEDIRKAIYRRWKGLGHWPFCHETYLDREMQYSDFNYFTYQFGGDGYYRHGIEGDKFSGHHYWQYYQWPGLTKDWIEGGRVGDKPSETEKTPYNLRDMPHHGTWVYLGLQQRWQAGAGSDEREWNNMPIWTPAWTFLPMQVKYWEEEDYQMRQQRQEINWWIAWYHWGGYYHSRPDPNDIDGDKFCYVSGNKYNPSSYDKQYIDDSWQPCFQHYQAAIDNLATQNYWGDYLNAVARNYWPDPAEDQEAYNAWRDVKNMVRTFWPTKSVQGYNYPTCGATDYHSYFLQNRLDYFLWLAEEQGKIEVDLWLHLIQKTSDETEWVIRPYWKMHNCDRDGEMSTHVLDDFKEVLKLMKYTITGHGYDSGQIYIAFNTELSGIAGTDFFGCSYTDPACIASKLWALAVDDLVTNQVGGGSGGAGGPFPPWDYWKWEWSFSEAVPPGGFCTLRNHDEPPTWCNGNGYFGIGKLTLPGIIDDGDYSVLSYDALVKKHIYMRSSGAPNEPAVDTHVCGAGGPGYTWSCCAYHTFCDANPDSTCCITRPLIAECSVQNCEFYVVASSTGIKTKSIGAHHCNPADDYTYQSLVADLRGVTSGTEMFWVSGIGASIVPGHVNSYASVNFRSAALEFDFSRVLTNL